MNLMKFKHDYHGIELEPFMYGVGPFIEQFNLHLLTQEILQITVKT